MFSLTGKWTRLAISTVTIFLTSSVYYGWQHYSEMLLKGGAYSWLCTPDSLVDGEAYLCLEQFNAVGSLYTYGSSFGFFGTLLAGILFDNVGPRWCGIIGELLFVVGYACIGFSSPSVRLYVPGFIMAGLSGAFVCFPIFVLSEIWPSKARLIMAHSMAVQLLTTFVAPVMLTIQTATNWSFALIHNGYVSLCVPFAILYCICLPTTRLELRAAKETSSEESSDSPLSGWMGYLRLLFTVEWIACLLWYVVQIMTFNAYNVNLRLISGADVAMFFGWLYPFEGVVGLLWGVLNVYFPTLLICMVMTVMNIVMLLLTFTSVLPLHYISATLYVLSNAHIYTTKYTYMSEIFEVEHFGKLSGSIGFVAGLLQLFNILIDRTNPDYRALLGGWAGACTVTFFGVLWIFYRQNYLGIDHKEFHRQNSQGTEEQVSVADTEVSQWSFTVVTSTV
ncbi:MAG: uncharacterized protein KVP18_003754 [Porospora cf. gigantea A]|uniref:uncharacterized protein n=1 Tax=Porospora cf. gigantea A TaxID=2853593 RepID=UPI00355A9F8A|nr:MAG: hypothetical protein KVP18_003754 [Porospora cf. gigantea A]